MSTKEHRSPESLTRRKTYKREKIREKRLNPEFKAKEKKQRIIKMSTKEEKERRKKYKQTEAGKRANKKYQQSHKDLVNKNARLWKQKNPEKVKETGLKQKYKISLKEWKCLWDNQEGKCAICGKYFNSTSNAYVDHDHKNGKVRGLLCLRHNLGIGTFDDNIDLLFKAIEYLGK